MKKLLETYQETIDQIFKLFGLENGYGEIDLRLETKWNADDDNVRWLEKYEGDVYSYDIQKGPWISQDNKFTMYYIDNGCGEKYYQIYENEFKDENFENDW